MREESRRRRQVEIEAAAYELIESKGYAAMSMLAVAKAARASNETLYNWYGDKAGLFRAMVDSNAAAIRSDLEQWEPSGDPMEGLARIAPKLLGMLVGPRAIALNRAAAADPTGELGRAIAENGRQTVLPLVSRLIGEAIDRGLASAPSVEEATEWFIALLVGDLQQRRIIGALPAPDEAQVARRAEQAFAAFRKLVAAR